MSLFLVIDILGTIAFAISGVLTAMKMKMDPFGILIVAFVTAIGGGTLRDILLDASVLWMRNTTFIYVIIGSAVFAVVFQKWLAYLRTSFFLFDTIGIALYTVVGVEKGIAGDYPAIICIALGTISACFGGVIRDILCNEIPVIFRKEVYATACIFGGLTYFILLKFSLETDWIVIISGSVVIVVRLLAVHFKLQLPSLYKID